MADILIIDDEENLAYSVQLGLTRAGHTCRIADTAEAGLSEAVRSLPDLALVDIQLPDMNGLDLLARFAQRGLDIPVVIITAFGTIDSAVSAIKQGAVDYVQKPLSLDELAITVKRCLENRRMQNQLEAYQSAQQRASDRAHIVAGCKAMQDVLALADRIAQIPVAADADPPTVLILGETGTGKEVVARYIHHRSESRDEPFVQVNCTAVPENLFESELFGHEPGAFSGASTTKKGLLEMAHEGTLFLDEIGDLPPAMQAKLLIAIEKGRFRRLGSTIERVARVRVIAATNADLEHKVQSGRFRADLFYRLKVFCIELPRLRDRGDDLPQLADSFLERFCRKFHKASIKLSQEAQRAIRQYPWPGNVRELANVLQRAVLVCDKDVIDEKSLGLSSSGAGVHSTGEDGEVFQIDLSQDCTLASIERRVIGRILNHANGNVSEAARILGLTRGGLRHRVDKLGLNKSGE